MNALSQDVNIVFQGGGVKGIALVAAYNVIEQHIKVRHYVGTSAGSIAAALLAAGYKAEELINILKKENFSNIVGITCQECLRAPYTFLRHGGLFSAAGLNRWLERLLGAQLNLKPDKICLFKDLPTDLTIIATDLQNNGAIYFSKEKTPNSSVAWAVKYSSTIPFLFVAHEREGSVLVDGGVVWNFALSIFDKDDPPPMTLGFALTGTPIKYRSHSFLGNLLTAVTQRSGVNITDDDVSRVVSINTHPIGPADFSLSKHEINYLLVQGKIAGIEFCLNHGKEYGIPEPNIIVDKDKVEKIMRYLKRKRRLRGAFKILSALLIVIIMLYCVSLINNLYTTFGEEYEVLTYAGMGEASNLVDSSKLQSTFSSPSGVTLDNDGNLYVADAYNNAIRFIKKGGGVETIARNNFNDPYGVAFGEGIVYVADQYNHVIQQISKNSGRWETKVLAGKLNEPGYKDGNINDAKFNTPLGVHYYKNDQTKGLFVVDSGSSKIRWIDFPSERVLTLIEGQGDKEAIKNGAADIEMDYPQDLDYDPKKNMLYVANTFNHEILRIKVSFENGTPQVKGPSIQVASSGEYIGTNFNAYTMAMNSLRKLRGVSPDIVKFLMPYSIALDPEGNLFVADYGNGIIWRIISPYDSEMQKVVLVAGGPSIGGALGFINGLGSQARFNRPAGLVVNEHGEIFVADDRNHRIRIIKPYKRKLLF